MRDPCQVVNFIIVYGVVGVYNNWGSACMCFVKRWTDTKE